MRCLTPGGARGGVCFILTCEIYSVTSLDLYTNRTQTWRQSGPCNTEASPKSAESRVQDVPCISSERDDRQVLFAGCVRGGRPEEGGHAMAGPTSIVQRTRAFYD